MAGSKTSATRRHGPRRAEEHHGRIDLDPVGTASTFLATVTKTVNSMPTAASACTRLLGPESWNEPRVSAVRQRGEMAAFAEVSYSGHSCAGVPEALVSFCDS